MKSTLLLSLVLMAATGSAGAADAPVAAEAASAATPASPPAPAAAIDRADMCFYTNPLPQDVGYTVVASKLKASKGTYGSVREMLPRLAAEARAMGGDAVMNYNGAQRFGFWPWRMTHPVVTGAAIRWNGSTAPDCEATGGQLMSRIIATDKAPVHEGK